MMATALTLAEPFARGDYGRESRPTTAPLYGVRGISKLYAAGDHSLLHLPSVAVVGSRAASHVGLALASELAAGLVRAGITAVSGLAFGIDAAAHQAAIAKRRAHDRGDRHAARSRLPVCARVAGGGDSPRAPAGVAVSRGHAHGARALPGAQIA